MGSVDNLGSPEGQNAILVSSDYGHSIFYRLDHIPLFYLGFEPLSRSLRTSTFCPAVTVHLSQDIPLLRRLIVNAENRRFAPEPGLSVSSCSMSDSGTMHKLGNNDLPMKLR